MSFSGQIIALDAMGGDFGPRVVVPAAALALQELKGDVRFLLFGDQAQIQPFFNKYPDLAASATVHHTTQVVANDEKPSAVIRRKDTSMRLAIEAVKAGKAQSVVSAGNTGALMASAKLVLRCLPGIERPAIASLLPTMKGDVVMLDLGANLVCDAAMLTQFAVLGAVYSRAIKGHETPCVGILNVGAEDVKGPDHVREAAAFLAKAEFPGKFYGFVEGDDLFKGVADVVVTDGFTGNIALKVAEGAGKITSFYMKDAFMSSFSAKLGALLARRALAKAKMRMDPRAYNGGMFLGLDGICVKSHGGMDSYGFSRAILVAANLVSQGYNDIVAKEIRALADGKTPSGGEKEACDA